MSRPAKPFKHEGWYKTNIGGKRTKLCKIECGFKAAEDALAKLRVTRQEAVASGHAHAPPGAGIAIVIRSKLVGEVHDEFLDIVQADNSPDTYRFYVEKLKVFFDRFGHRDIRSLTQKDGVSFKKWLRTEKEWMKGKAKMVGLGPTTVNHHLRAAKALLNWATEPDRDYIRRNPWKKVSLLPEQARERLITDEEFRHLVGQCKDGNVRGGGRDFRELLLVLRYTTLRPGEVRKLRWEYISFDCHRITFPAIVVKTKRRRPVSMLPIVEQVLRERQQRLAKAEGFVFPATAVDTDGKRAAVANEKCITAGHLAQRFRRLFLRCVKLGLIEKEKAGERLVLYSSRHTRITELVAANMPMKAVMDEAAAPRPARHAAVPRPVLPRPATQELSRPVLSEVRLKVVANTGPREPSAVARLRHGRGRRGH